MRHSTRPLETSWVSQVTLGSNNPMKTAAYLAVYGHSSFAAAELSSEAAMRLYGIASPSRQVVMRPSDLRGEIRIVETGMHARAMEPFQTGIHGIDLYTSDIDLSRAIAIAAGGIASQPVSYSAGSFSILELRILSAEQDFAIFISEVAPRPFPSALDQQPERQFSDQVTVVAFVDEKDVPAETEFWTETAGLELFRKDMEFDDDDMLSLMELPFKSRMGAVQFCDREKRRRLELLFYKHAECPRPHGRVLIPGFHSIGFPVGDLGAAIGAFNGVPFTEPCAVDFGKGATVAAAATSPGGIRFELFETRN